MKTKADLWKKDIMVPNSLTFSKPGKQDKWIYHVEFKREKSAEKFCQKLALARN